LKKHIDLGHDVVVWDESIVLKDINDMVMAGRDPADIRKTMVSSTCRGAEALLRFQRWKKVD
jgi:hypothetical protein